MNRWRDVREMLLGLAGLLLMGFIGVILAGAVGFLGDDFYTLFR